MFHPLTIEAKMEPTQPAANGERAHQPHLAAKYVSIERRTAGDTVFLVDEIPFHSTMPQSTHWSIAWSDLMMTMFVLFLSMYVYKAADQDFLNRQTLEVIGGDTTEALETDRFSAVNPPIMPIAPGLPLMTGGTVKKVESVDLRDIDIDSAFSSIHDQTRIEKEVVEIPADRVVPPQPDPSRPTTAPELEAEPAQPSSRRAVKEQPAVPAGISRPDTIQEIYRLSKGASERNDMEDFARVDMIPGNILRITLTGDQLFATGQASLTENSRGKMAQLATALQSTPYMINVIGHTDNVPMYSDRYPSNWELSVAQASAVTRFLIEDFGMDPNQFVVSGYASYRPQVPNTTAENRQRNRRVEIIVGKRFPNPVPADQQNLKSDRTTSP